MLGLGIGLNKVMAYISSATFRVWKNASFSFSDNNQSWS